MALGLERLQRIVTKMITALKQLSYGDKVKQSKITTSETKRIGKDHVDVFKFYMVLKTKTKVGALMLGRQTSLKDIT